MNRFTQLYLQLDQTNRTSEKVEAMRAYFSQAPSEDAIWAIYLLTGRKIGRTVSSALLRDCAVEATGLPPWLVEESYHVAGDLSETLSLILPDPADGSRAPPLHEVIEDHLRPLGKMTKPDQRVEILSLWKFLSTDQRFVLHKLLSTAFRLGVSRQLAIRALALAAQVPEPVMAHRLAGNWKPTTETHTRLFAPAGASAHAHDPALPYPFMLAHPLAELESLGDLADWQLEWKWDGIRAQLIARQNQIFLWSRGDELVADTFPEIIQAAQSLPGGTVLDGELLAWDPGSEFPLPFTHLQKRLNRKHVEISLWPDVPVAFLAFDLLEFSGKDLRTLPLVERRAQLESLLQAQNTALLHLSPLVPAASHADARSLVSNARRHHVEGLMIKQKSSPYVAGRPTGLWWKLKVEPYTIDAVLIAAQPGHGRRAGLLTDFTFALWHEKNLVPIAKAYSGLTDVELVELDRFVRAHTMQRFGPVYSVEPLRVYEIGFEAIQKSSRHKSGIAVRFPRILRPRPDKKPADADTLATLENLLANPHPAV